ncbi:MAG TPA: hypothetical protein VN577_13365 [Terriglobales bacterium]|nr:hypothetical protein [Terriglobales bacterium]
MYRVLQISLLIAVCWFAAYVAQAAEVQVPQKAVAGTEISLSSSGSGTLYLFGPGTAMKKDVKSGEEVRVAVKNAGRYTAILNGSASTFEVTPGKIGDLAFLARPSRVPADRQGVIAGTVFLFDQNKNMVLTPTQVKFDLSVEGGAAQSHSVQAKDGIAYIKMDSGRKAGAAQFVASAGEKSVRRVVQQTASDPCNLRMRVQKSKDGVVVETDPVRDCAGNPVPDGTIVTFTAIGKNGRSTIDSRVKKGIARAQFPALESATLSVASGVVMGNEMRWGGGM